LDGTYPWAVKTPASSARAKDPALITRQEHPLNLGTPLAVQAATRITPTAAFYVRCHGDVPVLDPASHRLVVDGLVDQRLELSLDDLGDGFPFVRVEAALRCAGNRRAGLSAVEPTGGVLQWDADAVGNTVWGGVRLRDVLARAGVRAAALHVAFEGADTVATGRATVRFGGSIPLERALAPSTLLASEMGGERLRPEHGHPLRALVAGYVGARSVKWLTRVTVQAEASANPFYATDYRLLPSRVRSTTGATDGLPLGETNVDSTITEPEAGARIDAGRVTVRGYALAGGDRTVERVEVTTDGRDWTTARFVDDGDDPRAEPGAGRWRWRRWAAELDVAPGDGEIAARAWDSAANTQPADAAAIWNVGGYMNNAWHRVPVVVRAATS
jgi:sulfite oxidase